ncbi:MAG TPA: nucleotidyltransferase domain-containing protein [Candidatus Nanoarchaeia archaeon]|nr:nucleotidyltransferase domain-containing protein [Candidatus Nanoarchaeia archaeon]HLD42423.1 nucleotidyltransferase domain-containing protein [Candidatus Nanoarchaeia archaeon]
MIRKLLPLTENKLRILLYIYEKKETHLQEISKNLKIHPYSLQKTIKSLKLVLEERKAGKTILLSLDKKQPDYPDLLSTIEDYKLKTKDKILNLLLRNLQELFSKDKNVLSCLVFGSYAREAVKESSDIDLLFVVKRKDKGLLKKCSHLSTLLGKEINPLVFNEKQFKEVLRIKEPAITSLLEPSQRLIILGREYFLKLENI